MRAVWSVFVGIRRDLQAEEDRKTDRGWRETGSCGEQYVELG